MGDRTGIEWTEATDLAYLAGVIDADGYVTATRSVHSGRTYVGAQVGITGSRREPHDLAARLFGGTVSAHRPTRNPRHLTQYHWQRGGRRAVPAIRAVLPYLRVKALRAQLVLDLQDEVDLLRMTRELGDFAPWMPAGWDPSPALSAAVDEIRASGHESVLS